MLDYVEPKSLQQVFDVSVKHILSQGRPSMTPLGKCMYNGPDGLHCGVAMFIPVEKRDEHENKPIRLAMEDLSEDPSKRNLVRLMSDLQIAHDDSAIIAEPEGFIQHYIHEVSGIARDYGLSTKVIHNATRR